MDNIKKDKGVNCTWHLNRDCNYRCSYCYVSKQRDLKNQRGHGIDIDLPAFKNNRVKWNNILMSGGEPFIYPNYVELCKKLTGFTSIDVNTNCSTNNIFDFADQINSKRVGEFHISLHLGQRPKNKWFNLVEKIQYLQHSKFNVKVTQVYHPTLIKEFDEAYKYFKDRSIFIIPKVFEGAYKLRVYPGMYSEDLRNSFIRYCVDGKNHDEIIPGLYGTLSWYNQMCTAGSSFIQIQYNGDAFRCQSYTTPIGNLYRNDIQVNPVSILCKKNVCTCMYEGLNYARGKPSIQESIPLMKYGKEMGMYYMNELRKRFK